MSDFECEQTLLVQADFDGELDAGRAAALVEHVAQCTHCRLVSDQLARSRALLRGVPRYPVPRALRDSVDRALRTQSRTEAAHPTPSTRTRRTALLGWGTALAASVVLAVMLFTASIARSGRTAGRQPRAVAAARIASHRRSVERPSHGAALVRRQGRLRAAREGNRRGRLRAQRRPRRHRRRASGRRAGLPGRATPRRGVHVARARRRGRVVPIATDRRIQRAALERRADSSCRAFPISLPTSCNASSSAGARADPRSMRDQQRKASDQSRARPPCRMYRSE